MFDTKFGEIPSVALNTPVPGTAPMFSQPILIIFKLTRNSNPREVQIAASISIQILAHTRQHGTTITIHVCLNTSYWHEVQNNKYIFEIFTMFANATSSEKFWV